MSTVSLTTANELLALPSGMGQRYELILGELRILSPGGWKHGNVISNIHLKIATFVNQFDLGMTFGAETGFRLSVDPDTVLAPDVAFIAKKNVPASMPETGFWPGAPDLAVEVLSPNDRMGEVDEKIEAWLNSGCQAVWVVDPQLETVTVYNSRTDVALKTVGESLDGGHVLPGFECAVSELF